MTNLPNFLSRSRFVLALLLSFAFIGGSCVYKFSETGTLPTNVKTFRINGFDNRAPYVNPQLAPTLSDRLRQKVTNQTRLSPTNSDNAHYDIHGTVTDYSVSTSGVTTNQSGQAQGSINRLTVTVHVILNDQANGSTKEFDVSRNFDFNAQLSLQSAEQSLLDQIVRNVTDEIFNQIFSNW
jgi:Lipopolysaccharide-assembly